jgi:hypothetical protein
VSTYTFRLRFTVSHAPAFLHDGETLQLELAGLPRPCILLPYAGDSVRDAKEFVLKSSGFDSEDAAREAGARARRALQLALVELRIGLSSGDRPSTLSFGKVVLDEAREAGYELRGDAYGLTVYPEDVPVRFASMQAEIVVTTPLDTFVERFSRIYEDDSSRGDSVSLGLELYGLSYFESSARARFVTLISAIESSVTRAPRTEQAQEYIDGLIAETRDSPLPENGRKQLAAALRNLKTESITTACRRFVDENGSPGDAETWERCHKLRHTMLHAGRTPSDLRESLPQLDEVVRRVFLAVAQGEPGDVV